MSLALTIAAIVHHQRGPSGKARKFRQDPRYFFSIAAEVHQQRRALSARPAQQPPAQLDTFACEQLKTLDALERRLHGIHARRVQWLRIEDELVLLEVDSPGERN